MQMPRLRQAGSAKTFFSQSDPDGSESESDPRGGEDSNRLIFRCSIAAMTKFNGGFQR